MAELGTPENPEIIDPSEPPRREGSVLPSRLQMARQVFLGLVSVVMPAVVIDTICWWLAQTAMAYGGFLTWLALLILALPAFLLTLVAVLATLVLVPVLGLVLSGRMKSFSMMNNPRMARFVNLRHAGRNGL